MVNSKNTKKALLSSAIALILCFSMLIGTTFAWFTDTVESCTNQILAGNLDVEVYHSNSKESNEKVTTATKLFDEVVLWEPGVVAYENITVSNVGTLALKYELAVNFDNENATSDGYRLSQILKVAFVEGGLKGTDREEVTAEGEKAGWKSLASFANGGYLYPADSTEGDDTVTYGIVIYWEPSDDDNNWNIQNGETTTDGRPLHIDLGIQLTAWQKDYEKDSFGDDYDKSENIWYVTNAAELKEACAAGGKIVLLNDIVVTETVTVAKNSAITSVDPKNPCTITSTTDQHGYLLCIMGSFASDGETYTPATVTMTNVIVDGGSSAGVTASRAAIAVGNNSNLSFKAGYLTLGEGAVVRNNNNTTPNGAGGGVCVIVGKLTINGGTIADNTANQGGGVAVVNNAAAEMKNGSISGNKAVTLYNSETSKDVSGNGGGVYLSTGTFIMANGEIKGNSAAKYGGGVYTYAESAVFELRDGIVSENASQYGAGFFINQSCMLELSGGAVTDNIAEKWGAGLLVAPDSDVLISGSIAVTGNTNTSGEAGANLYLDGDPFAPDQYIANVTLGEMDESADVELYAYVWYHLNEYGFPVTAPDYMTIITPAEGYTITNSDLAQLTHEDADETLTLHNGNVIVGAVYVAEVNGVKYTSIQKAIDAVEAEGTATVKVLEDHTVTSVADTGAMNLGANIAVKAKTITLN